MIPETLARAPQRLKVLRFIQAEIASGRPFPTGPEVSTYMGWNNPSSGGSVLSTLAHHDRVLKWSMNGKKTVYSLKDGIG